MIQKIWWCKHRLELFVPTGVQEMSPRFRRALAGSICLGLAVKGPRVQQCLTMVLDMFGPSWGDVLDISYQPCHCDHANSVSRGCFQTFPQSIQHRRRLDCFFRQMELSIIRLLFSKVCLLGLGQEYWRSWQCNVAQRKRFWAPRKGPEVDAVKTKLLRTNLDKAKGLMYITKDLWIFKKNQRFCKNNTTDNGKKQHQKHQPPRLYGATLVCSLFFSTLIYGILGSKRGLSLSMGLWLGFLEISGVKATSECRWI